MRKIARALALVVVVTGGALVTLENPAAAHVHAFTPLGCLETDNANAGAAVGFDQAADAAGPLNGSTPIIPWNASGTLPSGGQGAENACG
jgi:hypothetical protein